MKKAFDMPKIVVEQFVPNEYVAACGDTEYGVYKFRCDAPAGTLYYYDSSGEAHYLGSYRPCGDTHEAEMSSEFPNGFVDRNGNRTEDPDEAVVVWIEPLWYGGRDGHATTVLDRASWETAKS